jgi:hypothetical protein
MEFELLLGNARWDIIKAVSQGRASATELSKVTKSSLPNISQQVRLLEAYDLVSYVKDQKVGQGKPRQIYGLKREICHLTFAREGFADKRFFNPDQYHTMLLNVLFVPSMQDHPYLHKYLLNEEILQTTAVAFLKSSEAEIEVLIITDRLDEIRAKYSNTFVEHNGKVRKVVAWTHSLHELNDGLTRKESYFENLMKNPHILHDPKRQFERVKR